MKKKSPGTPDRPSLGTKINRIANDKNGGKKRPSKIVPVYRKLPIIKTIRGKNVASGTFFIIIIIIPTALLSNNFALNALLLLFCLKHCRFVNIFQKPWKRLSVFIFITYLYNEIFMSNTSISYGNKAILERKYKSYLFPIPR